ncbi:photosystem II reaction center protein Psb28 [Pleurocapsales cyanobacterium LEGE 06147]|nr:photosystem II reaction center protein Psb28 [Pleurocapsales cyanobacterium LEGE 06147]
MPSDTPAIEFFQGVSEELSNVSLRRNKNTGLRSVLLIFESLNALNKFNSFTKGPSKNLRFSDSEGDITVQPSSVKFIFGGDEGDELRRVECRFDIEREDHWERFMRFMNRYAEANDMEYGER